MNDKIKEKIKKNKFLFPLVKKTRNFFCRFLRPKKVYYFLNSKKPISQVYGLDRGSAIDRYYIKKFLSGNKNFIKGHCLEILNGDYLRKFGEDRVIKIDVLDIDKENKKANIICDLRDAFIIPDNTYNCIVLTQTIHFIDDFDAVISECFRILKPGGAVLATLPSLSRLDPVAGIDNDYWRFTKNSARYIFSKKFNNVDIVSFGNLLAGVNFLMGISKEEMRQKDLDYVDESFSCLIGVRAIK